MSRRVVVTGMGAITPLGHTVDELYKNQLEGKSGVDFITVFDARTFPTKFAAEVKNFDLAKYVKTPEKWASSGANSRFAAGAAQQASPQPTSSTTTRGRSQPDRRLPGLRRRSRYLRGSHLSHRPRTSIQKKREIDTSPGLRGRGA